MLTYVPCPFQPTWLVLAPIVYAVGNQYVLFCLLFILFVVCSQVPSCRLWARVSLALFEFFLTPKSDLIAPLTAMASHLDLDMKFSEA